MRPTTFPGGPRVLVVDDNVDAAEMLARALTAKGYQIKVTHDGPTALLATLNLSSPIGFLDLGLPFWLGTNWRRGCAKPPACVA